MRLWHRELLPYLPDAQFKGQLRELVAVMRSWRDTGKTNHLLINRVMEYSKSELSSYALKYFSECTERRISVNQDIVKEFCEFGYGEPIKHNKIFDGWHNKEYLRVCVCNLYEKYHFGVGKSKISQEEWNRVLQGYKEITGEDWVL